MEKLKLTKMLLSMYRRHQSGLNIRSSHSVLCEACEGFAECIRKSSLFSGTGQGTHRLAIWLDIAAQCDTTTPRYGFSALVLLARHRWRVTLIGKRQRLTRQHPVIQPLSEH